MTLLEAIVTIGSGIAGVLGGRAAVQWIVARRSITERALDMADRGREDTAQHVTSMVDCERRCGRLEGELAIVRADNQRLRLRIGSLERDVAVMREMIEGLLEQLAAADRRESATVPARVIEIVPAVSRLKDGR